MILKNRHIPLEDRVFDTIVQIISVIAILIVLYPLVFVLSASFSDPDLVISGDVWLLPKGFTLDSYRRVVENPDIWIGYKNTIFYTVIGTIINIILTIFAAYPLSKEDLKGRKWITLFITFTMIFQGGIVPTYLVVLKLGLIDTRAIMLLIGAVNVFNLIVARSYFQSNIPKELIEAAKIDGCRNFGVLFKIVFPLAKPIIAVLAVYYGVHHWNTYFQAMIYLQDRAKYPLQIFLRSILISNQVTDFMDFDETATDQIMIAEGIKYALIIVGSGPILVLYPYLQKMFVKGMTIGSIKG